jgi:hypothetical protein
MGSTSQLAVLAWTDRVVPGWTLSTMGRDGEQSDGHLRWEEPAPPTLLERYNALATLGFAVVKGGPGAWRWHEQLGDDGAMFLSAVADVRPLTASDVLTEDAGRTAA